MSGKAIQVQDLRRSFGPRRVLDGVSFELDSGACLAVFGPNGAGKTTLLRCLCGLLTPTSGSARLGGISISGRADARRAVGLVSHHSLLYAALSALENVEFAARLYGVANPRAAALLALERMNIAGRADTPARALSRGLQQRVSIARATVHDPRILLLDEPFSGLDETGAAALSALLNMFRERGAALVLVTHDFTRGLALATRTAVMRDGRFERLSERGRTDAHEFAATYRSLVAT